MDLSVLQEIPIIVWVIIGIIILSIIFFWRKKNFNFGGFLSVKEKQSPNNSINGNGVSIIGSNSNITINNNLNSENIKGALITGELLITKTYKRLIISNIGDKDAKNVTFICESLDRILQNKESKFPIKNIPTNSNVSFIIVPLTTSPSEYEVKWIYEDIEGNIYSKLQILTK